MRREWFPFVVTAGLLFAVPFAVDAVASNTWADLVALLYLTASPAVYRVTKRGTSDQSYRAVERKVRGWVPGS